MGIRSRKQAGSWAIQHGSNGDIFSKSIISKESFMLTVIMQIFFLLCSVVGPYSLIQEAVKDIFGFGSPTW